MSWSAVCKVASLRHFLDARCYHFFGNSVIQMLLHAPPQCETVGDSEFSQPETSGADLYGPLGQETAQPTSRKKLQIKFVQEGLWEYGTLGLDCQIKPEASQELEMSKNAIDCFVARMVELQAPYHLCCEKPAAKSVGRSKRASVRSRECFANKR